MLPPRARHGRTAESDGRRESRGKKLHAQARSVSSVYPPLHASAPPTAGRNRNAGIFRGSPPSVHLEKLRGDQDRHRPPHLRRRQRDVVYRWSGRGRSGANGAFVPPPNAHQEAHPQKRRQSQTRQGCHVLAAGRRMQLTAVRVRFRHGRQPGKKIVRNRGRHLRLIWQGVKIQGGPHPVSTGQVA